MKNHSYSIALILLFSISNISFSQNSYSKLIASGYIKMIKANEHISGFKAMPLKNFEIGSINGIKKLETILRDSLKWSLQKQEEFSMINDEETKSKIISTIGIKSINNNTKNLVNELKGIKLYFKNPLNAETKEVLELSETSKTLLGLDGNDFGNIYFIQDVYSFTEINNLEKTTLQKEFQISNEFTLVDTVDKIKVKIPSKITYTKSINTTEITTNSIAKKLNINGLIIDFIQVKSL